MKRAFLLLLATELLAFSATSFADPVRLRIVAANLTSGTEQAYSVTNGNHSNIEGAGARILKGLKPDVVLIQEFNTNANPRQWVNQTFGEEYSFSREEGAGIPNGVISRFPIVEQGEWDDPTQTNRDFAWAKIGLPNGKKLWAISVHLKSGSSGAEKAMRLRQAEVLVSKIQANIPAADYVVLGGDFNTSGRREACVLKLGEIFRVNEPFPEDQSGDPDTNSARRKPYDWVIADADLHPRQVPTQLADQQFANGLVLDTRVHQPLSAVAPAQPRDSEVPGMQHMAVVKDFVIPAQ
jgi:endonuclease/exonuclease/phosphatase family metal-dependent hydrolase